MSAYDEVDTSEVRPGRYMHYNRAWYRIENSPRPRENNWPEVTVMTTSGLVMPLTLFSTPVVQDEVPGPFKSSALNRKAHALARRIERDQRLHNRIRDLADVQRGREAVMREAAGR